MPHIISNENTLSSDDPQVCAWLNHWVDCAYQRLPLPDIPENYRILPSIAGVALLDQFNDRFQAMVAQYPESYRTNLLIPVLVLTRAIVAWQTSFKPDASDWLNLRTNLGYYQQEYSYQWRMQYPNTRPSILTWFNSIPEALNYEITSEQLKTVKDNIKNSANQASRIWVSIGEIRASLCAERPPETIQDRLDLCNKSISVGMALLQHQANQDTLPSFVLKRNPMDLSVPARDYQKGWDHYIRSTGREYAMNLASSHYPEGIPDTAQDRVEHIRYVEKYYQDFETAFEPWKWNGLEQSSIEEKAQVWAWITSWAPEYVWDETVSNFGVHPDVCAVNRDYTGKSTTWWLTASFDEKVEQAKLWLKKEELVINQSHSESTMDDFVANILR